MQAQVKKNSAQGKIEKGNFHIVAKLIEQSSTMNYLIQLKDVVGLTNWYCKI